MGPLTTTTATAAVATVQFLLNFGSISGIHGTSASAGCTVGCGAIYLQFSCYVWTLSGTVGTFAAEPSMEEAASTVRSVGFVGPEGALW